MVRFASHVVLEGLLDQGRRAVEDQISNRIDRLNNCGRGCHLGTDTLMITNIPLYSSGSRAAGG